MISAQERRTLRDILAGIAGALAMTAIIAFAQWLDAQDIARLERERAARRAADAAIATEKARAEAAAQAYQDGLDRIRCVGGWRIDALTGRAIDLDTQ